MKVRMVAAIMVCLIATPTLWAKEVAGVTLSDEVSVGGTPLLLNGAGVRSKFFVKLYVGGLYLPSKSHSAAEILAMKGQNRVVMHFLYDEVSRDKLVDGWTEGFEKNQNKAAMDQLRTRLDQFNALFKTVHSGDVIELDYLPDKGTEVRIKGAEKSVIKGADFNRALLSVWLGEEPADSDLKEALLGK
jgi:Chalcone isomerase-like